MRSLQQMTQENIDGFLYPDVLVSSQLKKLQRKRVQHETSILRQARKQFDERNTTQFCSKCLKKKVSKSAKCIECGGKSFYKETIPMGALLNPINAIGIEFEGGWDRDPRQTSLDRRRSKITYGLHTKGDGSVELDDGDYHIGEATTDPVQWNETGRITMRHIIQNSYPDYTNETCGGHVHYSFKNIQCMRLLMEREFYDGWISNLKTMSSQLSSCGQDELDSRWNNSYCQDLFYPEEAITGHGDRYAYQNWCSYGSHGTLEFRILPMFESNRDYWKAFSFLTDYIEDYIRDRMWLGKMIKTNINTTSNDPITSKSSSTKYVQKIVYSELVSALDSEGGS